MAPASGSGDQGGTWIGVALAFVAIVIGTVVAVAYAASTRVEPLPVVIFDAGAP